MCSTLIIGLRHSACLAPVNCSCLTAFVGKEANLLMHLQEPPRGDGASSGVNFLLTKWASFLLCNFLSDVACDFRLPCLPFVWRSLFFLTHTHTHPLARTHTHTHTHTRASSRDPSFNCRRARRDSSRVQKHSTFGKLLARKRKTIWRWSIRSPAWFPALYYSDAC